MGLGHDPTLAGCVLDDKQRANSLCEPSWSDLWAAAEKFNPKASQSELRLLLRPSSSKEEALLLLDATAQSNLLLLQFIDDAFVLQSTPWGLFKVCRSMSSFAVLWHHRFAGGKKAASLLCVGEAWPAELPLPTLDGEAVKVVNQLDILGTPLEADLSLHSLLSTLGSRLKDAAVDLGKSLDTQGLGISWHAEQFPLWAESAALFGCELLAAGAEGWPLISRKLNQMHYQAIKAVLGLSSLSLGEGGYALVLLWLGYSWRLSAKIAMRIVTSLARLLTLPPSNVLHSAVRAAVAVPGPTWVDAARGVAWSLGVSNVPSWETLPSEVNSAPRIKLYIQHWKRHCVVPVIKHLEECWRAEALSKLAWAPPADLRATVKLTRSLLWTPRMLKACKVWFLAVLTGRGFFEGWFSGAEHSVSERRCLLCRAQPANLTVHLATECHEALELARAAGLQHNELFSLPTDATSLRTRISVMVTITQRWQARDG